MARVRRLQYPEPEEWSAVRSLLAMLEGRAMTERDEQIAAELQRSPDYRVLRRFVGRDFYHDTESGRAPKVGLFVDVETTGLDPETDEIIQLAIQPFLFDNEPEGEERILKLLPGSSWLEEPKGPVSPEITELTGITPAMVTGQKIDDAAVLKLFDASGVALVIAHKAEFDRPRIERRFPTSTIATLPWACSLNEVDWTRHYGAVAKSLGAALAAVGEFSDGLHDALEDCRIGIHVLASATREVTINLSPPFDTTLDDGFASVTAFNDLLRSARVPTFRLWVSFPFDETGKINGRLKARKYRWNDGKNGNPKAWHRDVKPDQVEAERAWIQSVVANADIRFTKFTARDRWSTRV